MSNNSNSFFGEISSMSTFEDIHEVDTSAGSTSRSYIVRVHGKRMFMKHVKSDYVQNEKYNLAFKKEFEIGFNLEHPNIVRYYEYGKDKFGTFILTEYVEGCTLTELVKKEPEYFKRAKNMDKFCRQMLGALDYIHSQHILHLDLKPDNILVTRLGRDVKIIDFGFSYSQEFNTTMGYSPMYASPEQLQSKRVYDQRTDLFSFGMIVKTIHEILDIKPSKRYCSLINACTAKDPDNRIESASAALGRYFKKTNFMPLVYGAAASVFLCAVIAAGVLGSKINKDNIIVYNDSIIKAPSYRPKEDPEIYFANEKTVSLYLDSVFHSYYKDYRYLWEDGNMEHIFDGMTSDEAKALEQKIYDLTVNLSTLQENDMLEATKKFPAHRLYIYRTYRDHLDCADRDSLMKMAKMYGIR